MLRQLLGKEVYDAGARLYFERYNGRNANTAQFLACFEEASGQSLADFSREWLFSAGYPQVTVRYAYDAAQRELRLNLSQTRSGQGGPFILPFSFAAVDAQGRDIPGTARTVRFDSPEAEIVLAGVPEPAFLSVNRDAGFYGSCTDLSATPEQLALQVRLDGNAFNRVEAMRRLTDLERRRLMASPVASASESWLELYRHIIRDGSLSDGIKGYLLKIDEQPLDRALLPHVRESHTIRQRLLRAVLRCCGDAEIFNALHALDSKAATLDRPAAIERRFLRNAFLQLLTVSDTVGTHLALEERLAGAVNITDRLNTLAAIWQGKHRDRHAILVREGESLRKTLGGYLGYLQVIGLSPRDEVFDAVAEEERRPSFSLSHPGISRSLYVPLSLNNAQIWTPRGLRWLTDTVIRLAPVSEFTTLRLIAPCQAFPSFAPDLRAAVEAALREMLAALKAKSCPSVTGRLEAYLR
jgi:aminopeptidase N